MAALEARGLCASGVRPQTVAGQESGFLVSGESSEIPVVCQWITRPHPACSSGAETRWLFPFGRLFLKIYALQERIKYDLFVT